MQGSEDWTPLFVQRPDDGPLGPDALAMLHLEAELIAQGIEVGFDPRRPGETFPTKGWVTPIRLLVPASHLGKAKEIADDLLSASPDASSVEEQVVDDDIAVVDEPLFASDARTSRTRAEVPMAKDAIHPGCLISVVSLATLVVLSADLSMRAY